MMTFLLIGATAYLILGLVRLIQVGFVRTFNTAWAEVLNDSATTAGALVALIMLMMAALIWSWALWPFTVAMFLRDQIEERGVP